MPLDLISYRKIEYHDRMCAHVPSYIHVPALLALLPAEVAFQFWTKIAEKPAHKPRALLKLIRKLKTPEANTLEECLQYYIEDPWSFCRDDKDLLTAMFKKYAQRVYDEGINKDDPLLIEFQQVQRKTMLSNDELLILECAWLCSRFDWCLAFKKQFTTTLEALHALLGLDEVYVDQLMRADSTLRGMKLLDEDLRMEMQVWREITGITKETT